MFPGPDHDAEAIVEELGDIPAAGLFCNGEIGPVGGRSFLHGFTATMVLFGAEGAERRLRVKSRTLKFTSQRIRSPHVSPEASL